jgi:hypothetical protein
METIAIIITLFVLGSFPHTIIKTVGGAINWTLTGKM